ncbi:MAG: permease-like cell division protein FtsX [Pseudomonadota bacterium]|nr:permease-like cell division protein FtsX [Pseudomonadota bacterium]
MNITYLYYLLKSTCQNIRQHLVINLISIFTITFSLVIFGLYSFGYLNLKKTLDDWRTDFQVIVYLQDSISQTQLKSLKHLCESQPVVSRLVYVDKNKAMQHFRQSLGKDSTLLQGLKGNPLPASLELQLKSEVQGMQAVESLVGRIKQQPGVDELQYGQQWLNHFFSIMRLLHIFGLGVTGFLFFVTIFIVSNTIKLSFYSRRDAIDIMELVGATRFYIAIPYLLEGLFQGLIASLLSVAAVYGIYYYLLAWLQRSFPFLQGMVSLTFFTPRMLGGFVILGVLLGGLGFLVSFKWIRGN